MWLTIVYMYMQSRYVIGVFNFFLLPNVGSGAFLILETKLKKMLNRLVCSCNWKSSAVDWDFILECPCVFFSDLRIHVTPRLYVNPRAHANTPSHIDHLWWHK